MNKDYLQWYREKGIPETVLKKAEDLACLVEEFYGVVIDELFISNIVKEETEEYTSLWLFTDKDVVECKLFLTRTDIDIARYGKNVTYINYIFDGIESIKVTRPTSEIKLNVSLGQGMKCILTATGYNCEKLKVVASRFMSEYMKKM